MPESIPINIPNFCAPEKMYCDRATEFNFSIVKQLLKAHLLKLQFGTPLNSNSQ